MQHCSKIRLFVICTLWVYRCEVNVMYVSFEIYWWKYMLKITSSYSLLHPSPINEWILWHCSILSYYSILSCSTVEFLKYLGGYISWTASDNWRYTLTLCNILYFNQCVSRATFSSPKWRTMLSIYYVIYRRHWVLYYFINNR